MLSLVGDGYESQEVQEAQYHRFFPPPTRPMKGLLRKFTEGVRGFLQSEYYCAQLVLKLKHYLPQRSQNWKLKQ